MSDQPPYGYNQGGGYPPLPPQGDSKTKVLSMGYNIAALLCYLLPCFCCANVIFSILWLATEPKESHFVRFHAMQGLLLFGAHFVILMLLQVVGAGLGLAAPADATSVGAGGLMLGYAGGLLGIIQLCTGLFFLVLYIIGMVKANQGAMWKLPLIGDIAEKNA